MNIKIKSILIILLMFLILRIITPIDNTKDSAKIKNNTNQITIKEKQNNKKGMWISAKSLKPGMKVLCADGKWIDIKTIEVVRKNKKTYNIEIQDNHIYTVGKQNIVVHNQCYEGAGGARNTGEGEANGRGSNNRKSGDTPSTDDTLNGILLATAPFGGWEVPVVKAGGGMVAYILPRGVLFIGKNTWIVKALAFLGLAHRLHVDTLIKEPIELAIQLEKARKIILNKIDSQLTREVARKIKDLLYEGIDIKSKIIRY